MNEEDELAEGIGWFHELAKLPIEELIQQATDINRTILKKFVIASLPGHVPPKNQPPAEFAATVLELRANERGWNRALGRALIDADDSRSEGDLQGAISILRSFALLALGKPFGMSHTSRQTILIVPGIPVAFRPQRDGRPKSKCGHKPDI